MKSVNPRPRIIRRRGRRKFLHTQLNRLGNLLEREQISEYVQMLQRPYRMLFLNLVFGVVRGLGIALGFTLFTTLVVWFLNWLGALHLPVIGDFIAQLVRAVQDQLETRRY